MNAQLRQRLDERQGRWKKFLAPAAAPGFMFLVRLWDAADPPPNAVPLQRELRRERLEYLWQLYQHRLRQAAWLDDDALPYLDMTTGTEIFAEAFGCRVHYPPDSNPCALPLLTDPADIDALRIPELSTSSLSYLFEMADELRRRAGPLALLRLVDIQSPMDIAALILEKTAYYTAMLESTAAIKVLAGKARQLLCVFLDEWFRRYGAEYVAHYPDYFMAGGLTLSEDEIGSVSAEIFRELFLPELTLLSRRYGGLGMHCCAAARHQWDNFLKIPGLRLLNLCNPPSLPAEDYLRSAYSFFGRHCAQWNYGWAPTGPVETWPEQFPAGSRVVFEVSAKTQAEARSICAALNAIRDRIKAESDFSS